MHDFRMTKMQQRQLQKQLQQNHQEDHPCLGVRRILTRGRIQGQILAPISIMTETKTMNDIIMDLSSMKVGLVI